jgi:acyl transferase domain-containing protein/phosphopantetheinyl transferase
MTQPPREGIAIVGMSCLFPGAPDLDAYWHNILNKVDVASDPPPEAWDTNHYYDPDFVDPDKTYCKRGGYLGSLASFDPLAHGIPPLAVGGEPDQWLALQLAKDALADARCEDLHPDVRARTGIVLGKGTYLNGGNAVAVQRGLIVEQTIEVVRRLHPEHTDEQLELLRHEMQLALPRTGPETVPGFIPNIIVGRIANRLDLMGPTYTVDAACASSLVAVQQAVRHLLDSDCDLMLAGGAQVWLPVPTLNLFCQIGALSRRQAIRPFDAEADGTLLGEGIGIIVLKRHADAVRDGDRVYAVIRGIGIASDGRGASVMAPRLEGEVLALRRAYQQAGVEPSTVALVEAHGTGTPVGDATEIEALTQVFGRRRGALPHCAIGTVKSMITHTIPASGIAGIIKLALSLHQRVLPPTLGVETPNPKLGLDVTAFYLNTEVRPWIHGAREPRRAAVNAFGFGGINAHAILEQAPAPAVEHLPPWDSELCVLEARSPRELAGEARRLRAHIEAEQVEPRLADVAYTLVRRLGNVQTPLRLAIVAESLGDLAAKLEKAIERLEQPGARQIKSISGTYFAGEPLGRTGRVVLVFPGEGSQYPNMLADLCLHFPEVREAFDQVDRIYHGHPRGHLSSDWIFPRPAFSEEERRLAEDHLMQMDIAVESVLAGNHAAHALLERLGLHYDACIGHSTGEFSAAMAARALRVTDDERRTAFSAGLYRCYSAASKGDDVPRATLLAIAADREQVEAIAREAGGELFVGMDNCPHQNVLVGEPDAAERVRAILKREGIIHEQLPYDRAVHTPRFAAFAQALREVFAETEIRAPETPLYSCTTGTRYPDDPDGIRALLVEHWTSPVEFRRSVEALHDDGARVFVECGPRGNLTAFIDDILRGRDVCAVAVDIQRRSGVTQLNHLVGQLLVHDVRVDAEALHTGRGSRELDLDAPAAEPAGSACRVDLSTRWPMLRLSDEAVAAVRGTAEQVTSTSARATFHPMPTMAPAPTALAPPVLDAVADTDLDVAMNGHLTTMEQFLTAQAEVITAYLTPSAHGSELVLHRTYDPASDPHLDDHRIGGELAVVPLALSLAHLASAAAELVPGHVVTGLRDVRASRWIAVDDEPVAVELRASRLGGVRGEARVEVTLRMLGPNAKQGPPDVEAIVVLAARYRDPPEPEPPPMGLAASRIPTASLYTEVMFHGPRWQGVRAIEATGASGLRAKLEVLASAPGLPIEAVTLDAAGQLVGFWTAEHLERGQVVFPFRVAALDVFGPQPRAGELLTGVAKIALAGEHLVRSNIDVLDADGRLWMRLVGWEDRRFHLPKSFEPLALSGQSPISKPWEKPVRSALAVGLPVECRRVATTFTGNHDLWTRIWAQKILSSTEHARFAALGGPESRRLEWLAARTAAKEAVLSLLRDRHGLHPHAREIELETDGLGRPVVSGSVFAGLDVLPTVSLAHSGGWAVALAALDGYVGIDVEPLRVPAESFIETAFAAHEREQLVQLPGALLDEWMLRCWCAKEAVGKAIGTGLPHGPSDFSIISIDRGSGAVTVEVAGRLASESPGFAGERFVVHSLREDELVVATAIHEKGGVR